jgi:transmembrane sensor
MSDKEQNNSNDIDRQLARRIGDALPDVHTLSTETDALIEPLLAYKKNLIEEEESTLPINSADLWNSIENAITSDGSTSARILSFNPAFRKYAVVAALILISFMGIFWYQSGTSPTLIAESTGLMQTVSLTDGSKVTLRPYSKLFGIDQNQNKVSYQLTGEAYFDVAKNPNRIFSVEAGQAEVQVLGTKFVLSDWGNTSNVYLQEGRIQFTALKSEKSVILAPGQSSSIGSQTSTPSVTANNEAEYTDWLQNELIFNDKSVGSIFDELQQQYNIRIHAPESVRSKSVSGSIELGKLPAVLSDFELVLEGSFTQTGANSYLFKPNNK